MLPKKGTNFLKALTGAQCIDKEILISKNSKIDTDIKIDKGDF